MPVSVVVPIRVRLDHAVIAADPDALADAIATATTRALTNVRRAVLEPRGGYARTRLELPQTTFYGDAVGLLGADDIAELHARIEGAVGQAVATTGLDRPLWDPASAPEVLRVGDGAPYNPVRDQDWVYIVDSYGKPTAGPGHAGAAKTPGRGQAPPERTARRMLQCENNPAALLAAGERYVERTVREFLAKDYADFAPLGIQFRHPNGSDWLTILRVKLTSNALEHDGTILYQRSQRGFSAEYGRGTLSATDASSKVDRVLALDQLGPQTIQTRAAVITEVSKFLQQEKTLEEIIQRILKVPPRTRQDRQALELTKKFGASFWYELVATQLVEKFQDEPPFKLFRIRGAADLVLFEREFTLDVPRLNIVPLTESVVLSNKQRGQGTGKPGGTDTGVSGGTASEECGDQCFGYDETASYTLDGVEPVELITGPFECEPPVSEFGPLGKRMQELMDDIAITLRMNAWSWKYIGAFLISAARVIAARSVIISDTVDIGTLEDAKPAPQGRGNAGDAEVLISRSPAIQALRELAGVMPNLQYLDECAWAALGPSSSYLSECGQKRFGSSWILHYRKEFMPAAKEAVYGIFSEACKVAMIQLLSASGLGIRWIQDNFDPYFDSIEPLLLGAVKRISELRRMRKHLQEAEASIVSQIVLGTPGLTASATEILGRRDSNVEQRGLVDELKAGVTASAGAAYQQWTSARDRWARDVFGVPDEIFVEMEAQRAVEGTIERQPDGTFAVREKKGDVDRLWTKEELDRSIEMVTQIAASIDPLVKHMRNLESSVAAFQGGREPAYQYVKALVERMRVANRDAILEARMDRMWAFRTAAITETWEGQTVPGTGVRLANIHSMAHDAIGDAFQGSWLYAEGLKFLFDSEQGRKSLGAALEMFATIGAFVLLGPFGGFVVSAGFAAQRYQVASSHLDLVQGLIDPEAIMTYSEAELEMFMVHFEIALLIIPEGGAIARRAVQGGRTLLREGLRRGSKELAARAVTEMMEQLAKSLKGQLLKSFVHQVVMTKALEPVLQIALEPVFKVLQEEAALGEGGGIPASLATLAEFEAEYGEAEIELEPRQSLEELP